MKMLLQHVPAERFVEIAGFQRGNGNSKPPLQILQIHAAHQKGVVADDLGRRIAHDLIHQLPVVLHLRQIIVPCGHIGRGDARLPGKPGDAHQEIVPVFFQRLQVQVGSRRNDPDHLPAHQSLRQLRILHLFADGHLVALSHKAAQIPFHRMIRDAAHGRPLLKPAVLSGKRDLKLPGSRQRVVKKHFIKITEAVKKDAVRILLLRFHIFAHHRCHFCHAFRPLSYSCRFLSARFFRPGAGCFSVVPQSIFRKTAWDIYY